MTGLILINGKFMIVLTVDLENERGEDIKMTGTFKNIQEQGLYFF